MKTYTDELTPVDSVTALFKSADWGEREVSGFIYGTIYSALVGIAGYDLNER